MQQESRILIGNLDTDAEEAQVRDVFTGREEQVSSVEMPKHPKTGRSMGYAFVEMLNTAVAQLAIDELSGHSINGSKINMSLVESKIIHRKKKWYQFGSA